MILRLFLFNIFLFQYQFKQINSETVSGCTINNNNNNNNRRLLLSNKTSVTLSCENNGYILVQNLTFGVHKTSSSSSSLTSTCSYQSGDCTTRTTYIGMECNGLTKCNLDLNPQYLHICSQYSDYMMLDYSCLQGQSLSICDNRLILTSSIDTQHHLFIRSPNYPNEYENSLNCSCEIDTNKANIKFLDFYLEERDEMNLCSRDYLQIGNQSYCDSKIDINNQSSSILLNSSVHLTFKTNDVITRKGFWLMINSEQSIQISCKNSMESYLPSTTTTTTTTTTTSTVRDIFLPKISHVTISTNSSHLHPTRRYTLSFILILTIIFVFVLLLLNLILIILCWKQRRAKENVNSKSSTHRPFFCSKRSSTSSASSITYGETPVLTSLDNQKRQTTSQKFLFQTNQHLDTTPSTSITTAATGTYEDPNELMTLQRQQKLDNNNSLYIEHRNEPRTFCPIVLSSCSTTNTGYNRMIHFPPAPIHCHFSTSAQTFYPPHPHYPCDSQHIYETIQDGHCPYQRLAATLRRQQQQCTCYCAHNEQKLSATTDDNNKNITIESNPETLV